MGDHTSGRRYEAASRCSTTRLDSGALLLAAGAARLVYTSPVLTAPEWARLLEAAEFHGLTALVFRALQPVSDHVPSQVADTLAAKYRESVRRGLVLAAWLSQVMAYLNAASIPAIVLKGPPLAQALYPDPALRPSFDLDVLVRPADLERTLDVLAREGYAPAPHLARFSARILLRLDCEVALQNPHRTPVDLHWAIAPADYPFPLDPDLLWRSRDHVEIAGLSVPVLSREGLLVYLAAHAAKHAWARLLWVSDIVRLVEAPLDWAAAMRLAAESRCTRLVHVAMLLAQDLLRAPVPVELLVAARADIPAGRAAADASERLLRMPPRETSTVEGTAFNARLATGLLAKARHWAAIVITPKAEDLSRWRLPERLFWLYRPLRIQRLLRKYGRKLLRS